MPCGGIIGAVDQIMVGSLERAFLPHTAHLVIMPLPPKEWAFVYSIMLQ